VRLIPGLLVALLDDDRAPTAARRECTASGVQNTANERLDLPYAYTRILQSKFSRERNMTPAIALAMLTSVVSLLAAIAGAVTSHLARAKTDAKLARLAAELQGETEAIRAQREYEFEARKHLYRELSPLLFQAQEALLAQRQRVLTIAEWGRRGQLGQDGTSLTGSRAAEIDPYLLWSTIYRLISPVCILVLVRRRLTILDLRLDKSLSWQYQLLRLYAAALSAGDELANTSPAVEYEYRSQVTPSSEKQSFSRGRVEQLAECMIIRDSESGGRVMSYSEFEASATAPEGNIGQYAKRFNDRLLNFRPDERPVLWRMFLVTALIAEIFSRSSDASAVHHIDTDLADFDIWRWQSGKGDDAVRGDLDAARSWLNATLQTETASPAGS
jgi:hypothetical protein